MSKARLLLKGSFFRNAQMLVVLGASFFITPLVVRSLGSRLYGFWTLIGAFVGYYGLMDLGLSSAAARYLSQALGREDAEELNATAAGAFSLFSLLGTVVLLLAAAVAAAGPLFIADPAEAALFRKIMLIMGAGTAAGFPLKVYTGLLTSYLRYDLISYLSISRALLANAAIYFLLRRGGGIMDVAAVTVAASLLQNAAAGVVCRLSYPEVRAARLRFDAARIRLMFGYGWKTLVCQLGDVLRFRLDSVVIAAFLNVSLLTPYSIGVYLVEGFGQLVLNSVGMMLPVFSQYEGQGDYDSMRSALLRVTRVSALLSAFVGYSIVFYAPAFIRRWMGPGYEGAAAVAAILTAGFILELAQSPGIQLLYGVSKHEYYAALNACEGAANLALSLLLLRRYGMYGVALGTTIEMIFFKLFVQPVYICRVIGLPVRVYLVDMILGTLAKSAVPLGLYFFVVRGLVLPQYPRLVACVAAQALFFAPAAYFFIISEPERVFLRRTLRLDEAFRALGLAQGPAA